MTDAPFAPGVYGIVNPTQEDGIIAILTGAVTNPLGQKHVHTTLIHLYFAYKEQNFPPYVKLQLFWFGDWQPKNCAVAIGPFLPSNIQEGMLTFKNILAAYTVPKAWFAMIWFGRELEAP